MIPSVDHRDLAGKAFACLAGCGFCCTMQPEVSAAETAALRARVTPLRLTQSPEGRQYLQLQGGCGACTLLERRECSQYDLRPQHCRWFPFHLYFGETAEAYLNYTCRGVERRAGGDLAGAFRATVLDGVAAERVAREAEAGRAAHAEFRERAEDAGAWEDPRPLLDAARRDPARHFAWDALAHVWGDARAPFEHPRPESRPYYLDRKLRWLTFAPRGRDDLLPAEMDEKGRFAAAGPALAGVARYAAPAEDLARALGGVMADRLLARGVFVGGVFDRVDDADYEVTVADAAGERVAEIAADLLLRARIVASLEPDLAADAAALADEAARFYDTEFLDQPTIGGFL